jgi:hypothetical protein
MSAWDVRFLHACISSFPIEEKHKKQTAHESQVVWHLLVDFLMISLKDSSISNIARLEYK